MAINFPDSPTTGDSFTAAGRTWIWDGTTWNSSPLISFDVVSMDTTAAATAGIGEFTWNAAEETLDIGLNADVTLQVGQEQLIRVKNMTGVEIPNGTAVQFAGVNGDQIQVAPAVADGSVDHHYMMGVTTEAILHGESGFVTTSGLVRGLATDGYGIAGTILYIDPATPGGLTATVPTAPNLKCPVAAVTKSGPGTSGILMVRMEMGENLADLHDVNIDATLAHGQVLQYQAATGRWENGTIDLSSKADVVNPEFTISGTLEYEAPTPGAEVYAIGTDQFGYTAYAAITNLDVSVGQEVYLTGSDNGGNNIDNVPLSIVSSTVNSFTYLTLEAANAEDAAQVANWISGIGSLFVLDSAARLKQDFSKTISATELGYIDNVTSSVQTQIGNKAEKLVSFVTKSGSTTLALTDADKMVEVSAAATITVPTNASVAFPVGATINLTQTGTGTVTVVGESGVTVNYTPSNTLRAQWSSAVLVKRATDTWLLSGDLL